MQQAAANRIGVLYTGGTFGMVRSGRGYVPSSDLPERAEAALHSAGGLDVPALEWLDHAPGPPINSSDITPGFWYALADIIRDHAQRCAGFVVIHGTDTMAYTGSALSFLLGDLDRPVVVTGARAPLGEHDSDALANLRDSIRVVAGQYTREVAIAFAGRLLRANRTSKRHGSREQVFDSPRATPIARLEPGIEPLSAPAVPDHPLPRGQSHDRRVALLPTYPGISGEIVRALVHTGIHGLVLEAYPAGIGPGGDAAFVDAVRAAVESGVIVAAVPQSRHGAVQLGRYATSTPLAEAGLVSGADMTCEAALTKLHWLLGTGLAMDAISEHFRHNLRGELTEPA